MSSNTNNSNKLWLEAIKDNLEKIINNINSSEEINTSSVVDNLREQYRLITILRKVKQRKTTIRGFYRKKQN